MIMKDRRFVSLQELANILGISRIAVYKKVKKGQIKAIRIGRSFAVPRRLVANILGKVLSEKDKNCIDKAIKKTMKDYGEVLKLLGKAK
jgi:excisionase family DNA binding protein